MKKYLNSMSPIVLTLLALSPLVGRATELPNHLWALSEFNKMAVSAGVTTSNLNKVSNYPDNITEGDLLGSWKKIGELPMLASASPKAFNLKGFESFAFPRLYFRRIDMDMANVILARSPFYVELRNLGDASAVQGMYPTNVANSTVQFHQYAYYNLLSNHLPAEGNSRLYYDCRSFLSKKILVCGLSVDFDSRDSTAGFMANQVAEMQNADDRIYTYQLYIKE